MLQTSYFLIKYFWNKILYLRWIKSFKSYLIYFHLKRKSYFFHCVTRIYKITEAFKARPDNNDFFVNSMKLESFEASSFSLQAYVYP